MSICLLENAGENVTVQQEDLIHFKDEEVLVKLNLIVRPAYQLCTVTENHCKELGQFLQKRGKIKDFTKRRSHSPNI